MKVPIKHFVLALKWMDWLHYVGYRAVHKLGMAPVEVGGSCIA